MGTWLAGKDLIISTLSFRDGCVNDLFIGETAFAHTLTRIFVLARVVRSTLECRVVRGSTGRCHSSAFTPHRLCRKAQPCTGPGHCVCRTRHAAPAERYPFAIARGSHGEARRPPRNYSTPATVYPGANCEWNRGLD